MAKEIEYIFDEELLVELDCAMHTDIEKFKSQYAYTYARISGIKGRILECLKKKQLKK